MLLALCLSDCNTEQISPMLDLVVTLVNIFPREMINSLIQPAPSHFSQDALMGEQVVMALTDVFSKHDYLG